MSKFLFLTAFIFSCQISFAQTDEYQMPLNMLKERISSVVNVEQLRWLDSFFVDKSVRICGYSVGDFSGDRQNDLALSVKTLGRNVDVLFFRGGQDRYDLIGSQPFSYVDVSIEVAFLIKRNICYVTSRDAVNWYWTGYRIFNNEIRQVSRDSYSIN